MTTAPGSSSGIIAHQLSKTFYQTVRKPGFGGALRSLVKPVKVAKTAVSNATFTAAAGELLALLGPNGAGKSTTIKMLTGILVPTSGEARVAGTVPHRERERTAGVIGVVFGQRSQLWWDLPARDSFAILRDIYDVPDRLYADRLKEFDSLLELSRFWDTRVRHLSLGQRVRCDLAGALLHDPPIVFLDEPTIGMDVVVKEQVRGFLRHQVEQRGKTVLLTTHDMTEVARLAERVVLINHGRIVLDGTLAEIRGRFGGTWQVQADLADSAQLHRPPPQGVRMVRRHGLRVGFGPDGDDPPTVHQALRLIIERYQITDLSWHEHDLEDVMRAAYLEADPDRGGVETGEAGRPDQPSGKPSKVGGDSGARPEPATPGQQHG